MMLNIFHFFFSSDEPRIRNPYRWLPRKDEKDKKDKKKPSDKSASSESQVKSYIKWRRSHLGTKSNQLEFKTVKD